MITKLTFKDAKTYDECQEELLNKIDEIIEVVNSLSNPKVVKVLNDIECMKASIGTLEAHKTQINSIISK